MIQKGFVCLHTKCTNHFVIEKKGRRSKEGGRGGTCKTHDDDDVYQYKRAIDSKKKKYGTRIKQLPSQISLPPDHHPFPQCSQMGMATMGYQKGKKEGKRETHTNTHTHKDTRCYSHQST